MIVGFLLSQRTERGAYVNKQGEEDLYYTTFGWLLESALGLRQDAEAMERYIAEVDLDLLREYRACEVHGNAYRRPELYGALLDETVNEPFIRNDKRG